MGNILAHFFLPHPPAAIPQVGGRSAEELTKTIEGFTAAAQTIAALKPDTIIVITPHGPCFSDMFYMPSQKRISGDFAAFGCKKLILGFDNDLELAKTVSNHAANSGLNAGFADDLTMKRHGIPYDLDHGVTVPLYFVRQYYGDFKVLPISLSAMNGKGHYRFGILLREAVLQSGRNVVVIASGNLSHKLSADSAYGHAAEGEQFDKTVKKLLLAEDPKGFLTFDAKLKENAAQCGLDALRVLLGTLDGFAFLPRILSYEAPTGIGYLAAELTCGKAKESAFIQYLAEEAERQKERRSSEKGPVKLARYAIEAYLKGDKDPKVPADTPAFLTEAQGGTFVSLYNDGQLRGSVGTAKATHPDLAMEIIHNAICAAAKDPRFEGVSLRELDDITITVDIPDPPEEITDRSELNPAKYGIIVENRGKVGILLPDSNIATAEDQIRAAREKAGIHPWHRLKIQRFTTTRYE